MSLRVNGLKIKKGNESNIDKIIELLKEPLIISLKEEARLKTVYLAERFVKYYERRENKEGLNSNQISFDEFFDSSIFIIKKKFIDPKFFNEVLCLDSFPLLVETILLSKPFQYDKYDLKIFKNTRNDMLIILPFSVRGDKLPSEIFQYCDDHSVENQTDDIPPHFANYKEKEKAISDWYDVDFNGSFLSKKIEISLDINEWLLNLSPDEVITKINIRLETFKKHFLNGREMDYHQIVDEIIDLNEDEEFNRLFNIELEKEKEIVNDTLTTIKEMWNVK